MSAQTNKPSALRRSIAVAAGVVALAFSASAWAEPVALLCDETGIYEPDGVPLNMGRPLRTNETFILNIDNSLLSGMPAIVNEDKVISVGDVGSFLIVFSLDRYSLAMETWNMLSVSSVLAPLQSMLSGADTVEKRRAVVTEVLGAPMRSSVRTTYQCRVQPRGV